MVLSFLCVLDAGKWVVMGWIIFCAGCRGLGTVMG